MVSQSFQKKFPSFLFASSVFWLQFTACCALLHETARDGGVVFTLNGILFALARSFAYIAKVLAVTEHRVRSLRGSLSKESVCLRKIVFFLVRMLHSGSTILLVLWDKCCSNLLSFFSGCTKGSLNPQEIVSFHQFFNFSFKKDRILTEIALTFHSPFCRSI